MKQIEPTSLYKIVNGLRESVKNPEGIRYTKEDRLHIYEIIGQITGTDFSAPITDIDSREYVWCIYHMKCKYEGIN